MVHIYPSLMAADPLSLKNEIEMLEPYCAGFHIDVMDNVFVPNTTWDADEVNAIAKMAKLVWVHLMVENPELFYATLLLPVDSIVSFHIESKTDVFKFIKIIREKKHKVSIAISPKTPISRLLPFLQYLDQVLLMSVEPGFSGQPFLTSTIDRLIELVGYRKEYNAIFRIGIDGGINTTNIKTVVEEGADDCAVATAIFQKHDHVAALQQLQELILTPSSVSFDEDPNENKVELE